LPVTFNGYGQQAFHLKKKTDLLHFTSGTRVYMLLPNSSLFKTFEADITIKNQNMVITEW
jgi:hypothetical protein